VADTVFVDSNIPMYLVGGPHPHKVDAQKLLEQSISSGARLVTDAEVLQEILHRYTAIDRRSAIQPAFDALLGVVDEVCPIDRDVVERAKRIVLGKPQLSARDAVHLAVMETRRIAAIMSFDAGFDQYPGVERVRL
jgi:predicted nucleic acid-binding protein